MNQGFYVRQGIIFLDMTAPQSESAFGLLRAALSARRLKQTRDIMRLNETLAGLTGGNFNESREISGRFRQESHRSLEGQRRPRLCRAPRHRALTDNCSPNVVQYGPNTRQNGELSSQRPARDNMIHDPR